MSSERRARQEVVGRVMAQIRANSDQTDRLDQLASARFGLNRTDGRGLELLRRLGPMTANTLAKALGMTTGGVTTVIDRLERAGYARRRRDSNDRRRVLVEATEQAARREGEIFGDLIAKTMQLVASYDDQQLELVHEFLSRMGAIVEAHSDRLQAAKRIRRRG